MIVSEAELLVRTVCCLSLHAYINENFCNAVFKHDVKEWTKNDRVVSPLITCQQACLLCWKRCNILAFRNRKGKWGGFEGREKTLLDETSLWSDYVALSMWMIVWSRQSTNTNCIVRDYLTRRFQLQQTLSIVLLFYVDFAILAMWKPQRSVFRQRGQSRIWLGFWVYLKLPSHKFEYSFCLCVFRS